MKNVLYFVSGLLLFASCSESKMLSKSLSKYRAPLNYLHDSPVVECARNKSISWTVGGPYVMDSATVVKKNSQKILPFLFYNYTEVNLGVNLGQSSLEQNYTEFFKESFQTESERTGCYALNSEAGEKDYFLEIQLDTCSIKSSYQRNSTILFFLFAYSMYFQEIGFPAETALSVNVKLHQGQKIIFEKNYTVSKEQPFIQAKTQNVNNLRADFVTNMTEALSLSTKDCIGQIINDLNAAVN